MSPADLFSSVVGHALFILTGLAGAAGGAGCGHKRRGAGAAQWWPEHSRARAPPTWSPSTGRPFSEAPRAGSGGRRCATTAGRARRSCGSPPRSARRSGGAPASAAPAPPLPGRWDGAAVRRGDQKSRPPPPRRAAAAWRPCNRRPCRLCGGAAAPTGGAHRKAAARTTPRVDLGADDLPLLVYISGQSRPHARPCFLSLFSCARGQRRRGRLGRVA